jgi:nicotinamidase-related amidase
MPTPALLVIDIQRGAFDGVRWQPIDSAEQFVQRANQLVDAARAGARPIVFIQHCEDTPGELFETHTEQWQLHPSLAPAPGEAVVRKYASSAFDNTDLHALLQAKGVDELVLCGLQSEFCVSNTTRGALALGYRVRVAQDAHSTWAQKDRSAQEIKADVNTRLAQAGAALEPTDHLVGTLRGIS